MYERKNRSLVPLHFPSITKYRYATHNSERGRSLFYAVAFEKWRKLAPQLDKKCGSINISWFRVGVHKQHRNVQLILIKTKKRCTDNYTHTMHEKRRHVSIFILLVIIWRSRERSKEMVSRYLRTRTHPDYPLSVLFETRVCNFFFSSHVVNTCVSRCRHDDVF